ncbi:SPOR domain-containing protein [Thiomicrorhabdus arctica]|jgi:septal ring-binding cell division protein DamX|uniref:SPOR domain-containing protein n=1 Tax=Thiomicrorhabdus arctica TaxID=131540 RepID=UPI000366EA88|nr:SPOR domain-containing protein [Thiomicrorhabdus arctica]
MSLTISELESERAKILEEIESKAQSISSSKMSAGENHSLKDWLKAAEEVMPTSEPVKETQDMKNSETRSSYSTQVMKPAKNKASFFGVIIMLSLLLTLLGVLYIAYTSVHKELQSVLESNQHNTNKMNQLQIDMDALQKSTSSGGKPELFISLEDKVFALEAQVLALQTALKKSVTTNSTIGSNSALNSTSQVAQQADVSVDSNKIITEAVLDEKLKQLEQKIDQKLQTIINFLSSGKEPFSEISSVGEDMQPATEKEPSVAMTIAEPSVIETQSPVITQPQVQSVQSIKAPVAPQEASAPIENYTADVKWLMNEPALNYTLQLASMPDQPSVEAVVRKKNLTDVRIIPQTRNQTTNYILLTGSFKSRKTADKFAQQYKMEFGISPWVRKVKNITARVK